MEERRKGERILKGKASSKNTCSRGMLVDFSKKSMSREVTIPTSLPPIRPFSVIGMPQKPFWRLISRTSPTYHLDKKIGKIIHYFLILF